MPVRAMNKSVFLERPSEKRDFSDVDFFVFNICLLFKYLTMIDGFFKP